MAPPPRTKRLSADTFEGAPEWFLKFLGLFNDFATDVGASLERGITRGENLAGQYETRAVRTGASVTADAQPFPIIITPRFSSKPRGLWVVDSENLTTGAAFAAAVFPTWSVMGDGRVKIRFLTGLAPNEHYRLTFALE